MNEIWKAENISSGNKDDLFQAIITADNGTKLIAQVPSMKIALKIVREHNLLLPPQEWVCPYCECDIQDAEHSVTCPIPHVFSPETDDAVELSLEADAAKTCVKCGADVTGLVYCKICGTDTPRARLLSK